jgi:hypothetical protein
MEPWTLVRFSVEEIADGVATRLLRDFMSLAIQDLREIGVFSSELSFQGKCLYFSPCAASAFASVLAKLPFELCDPPNPEKLLCLYGAAECLPMPMGRTTAPGSALPTRPEQLDQLGAEPKDDPSSTETGWSSIRDEVTRLLPEIRCEEVIPDPLIGERSNAPSRTYRLLRAVLVTGVAAVIFALASPYVVWFAVALTSR